MEKLRFRIQGLGKESSTNSDKEDFILEEADWNDYGLYTLYSVRASKKILRSNTDCFIGEIRIWKDGQGFGKNHLCNSIVEEHNILEKLPSNFMSFVLDKGLVDNLFLILDKEQRRDFVESLHVILDYSKQEFQNKTEGENHDTCFRQSILRSTNMSVLTYESFDERINYAKKILLSDIEGQSMMISFLALMRNWGCKPYTHFSF
ncbi:MAG: hypothetical protein K5675_11320 [Lachnospiraceae bacterium]|nr:hypothetical protein [Lachnospiraceae bacterium]